MNDFLGACCINFACCSSTVVVSKSFKATFTSNTFSIWLANLVAFKLCPPRSKKSSLIPILSLFKTSFYINTNFSSVSLPGETYSTPVDKKSAGSGNILLSILPLVVNGISSNCTKWFGTIYQGNFNDNISLT